MRACRQRVPVRRRVPPRAHLPAREDARGVPAHRRLLRAPLLEAREPRQAARRRARALTHPFDA